MLVMQLKVQRSQQKKVWICNSRSRVMGGDRTPYDGLISEPSISCDFSWLLVVAILIRLLLCQMGLVLLLHIFFLCIHILYRCLQILLMGIHFKLILSICMESYKLVVLCDLWTVDLMEKWLTVVTVFRNPVNALFDHIVTLICTGSEKQNLCLNYFVCFQAFLPSVHKRSMQSTVFDKILSGLYMWESIQFLSVVLF